MATHMLYAFMYVHKIIFFPLVKGLTFKLAYVRHRLTGTELVITHTDTHACTHTLTHVQSDTDIG